MDIRFELRFAKAQAEKRIDIWVRHLAWRLPRRLVMWCCYRVAATATSGEWGNVNPGDLKFFEMMERWRVDVKV